jgi:hypothetical protein
LDIAITDEGLYVAVNQMFIRRPPILIPWNEIVEIKETRLYWRPAVELTIGKPPLSHIVIFREVFEKIKPHLDISLSRVEMPHPSSRPGEEHS